ncbi:MAG: M20/M25/M40 family metallo-hydrolase [Planctomycetota bacterium]
MAIPQRDRERVFNACEELEQETIDLLAELVKIPSENPGYKYEEKLYLEKGYTRLYDEPITRGGETRVCEHLRPLLESFCDDTAIVASDRLRANLVGIINRGAGKSLTLNAHVDTVPTGDHDEWASCEDNPFNPVIKGGRLYGRGATDSP